MGERTLSVRACGGGGERGLYRMSLEQLKEMRLVEV